MNHGSPIRRAASAMPGLLRAGATIRDMRWLPAQTVRAVA